MNYERKRVYTVTHTNDRVSLRTKVQLNPAIATVSSVRERLRLGTLLFGRTRRCTKRAGVCGRIEDGGIPLPTFIDDCTIKDTSDIIEL
jgi:hypothetical protein